VKKFIEIVVAVVLVLLAPAAVAGGRHHDVHFGGHGPEVVIGSAVGFGLGLLVGEAQRTHEVVVINQPQQYGWERVVVKQPQQHGWERVIVQPTSGHWEERVVTNKTIKISHKPEYGVYDVAEGRQKKCVVKPGWKEEVVVPVYQRVWVP